MDQEITTTESKTAAVPPIPSPAETSVHEVETRKPDGQAEPVAGVVADSTQPETTIAPINHHLAVKGWFERQAALVNGRAPLRCLELRVVHLDGTSEELDVEVPVPMTSDAIAAGILRAAQADIDRRGTESKYEVLAFEEGSETHRAKLVLRFFASKSAPAVATNPETMVRVITRTGDAVVGSDASSKRAIKGWLETQTKVVEGQAPLGRFELYAFRAATNTDEKLAIPIDKAIQLTPDYVATSILRAAQGDADREKQVVTFRLLAFRKGDDLQSACHEFAIDGAEATRIAEAAEAAEAANPKAKPRGTLDADAEKVMPPVLEPLTHPQVMKLALDLHNYDPEARTVTMPTGTAKRLAEMALRSFDEHAAAQSMLYDVGNQKVLWEEAATVAVDVIAGLHRLPKCKTMAEVTLEVAGVEREIRKFEAKYKEALLGEERKA